MRGGQTSINLGAARLRFVGSADFRKNEVTMYREAEQEGALPAGLKAGDVVAFVSTSRDQIVFVSPPYQHLENGREVRLYASRRLRISSGRWNPLMLQNYADEVGLQLLGLKRFEEHYETMRRARTQAPSNGQPERGE
jgi:hypothetical protein